MVVAVEAVLQDLLVAGADMGEEVMTEEEEGMIADIHLGADIVEDIEVEAEAIPHTESLGKARRLLALQYLG